MTENVEIKFIQGNHVFCDVFFFSAMLVRYMLTLTFPESGEGRGGGGCSVKTTYFNLNDVKTYTLS